MRQRAVEAKATPPVDKADRELFEFGFNPDFLTPNRGVGGGIRDSGSRVESDSDERLSQFATSIRKLTGLTSCRTAADVHAIRAERVARAAAMRKRLRQLERQRFAFDGRALAPADEDVVSRLTSDMTRLRAGLMQIAFDAQLSRNSGDGGRPPSPASVLYALVHIVAEIVDERASKVLRAVFAKVPDNAFIRREIAAMKTWRARRS